MQLILTESHPSTCVVYYVETRWALPDSDFNTGTEMYLTKTDVAAVQDNDDQHAGDGHYHRLTKKRQQGQPQRWRWHERCVDIIALPAGRDLLLESPCNVKRFLALAAEWPDWPAEASAEWESERVQGLVQRGKMKKKTCLKSLGLWTTLIKIVWFIFNYMHQMYLFNSNTSDRSSDSFLYITKPEEGSRPGTEKEQEGFCEHTL